jgi:hypothetical protein
MNFNDYYDITGGVNADRFYKLTISLDTIKCFTIVFYYHNIFYEGTFLKVKKNV